MTTGLTRAKDHKRVMKGFLARFLRAFVAVTFLAAQMDAGQMRPITVEDCVRTRRVMEQELALSPDGTRVAYVVKAPNTLMNFNDYRLYVRELSHLGARESGHILLQADGISGIRWLGSGALMARVENKSKNGKSDGGKVEVINSSTGALQTIAWPGAIEKYSASADGSTIVFSVGPGVESESSGAGLERQKFRDEHGYPITFGVGKAGLVGNLPEDEIYVAKREVTGKLQVRKLYFAEPGEPPHQSSLRDVRRLDLSPDGKHLLITHSARSLPPGWADEPEVQFTEGWGSLYNTYVLSLCDMETGRLRLGFNFMAYFLETQWSQDSRSYSVVSPSPFGTEDGKAETQVAAKSGLMDDGINWFQHVFVVDADTLATARALPRENKKMWKDLPLFWKHSDGPMLVRAGDGSLVWVTREQGEWKETGRVDLRKQENFLSSLVSDGQTVVGVSETTMDPPNLFTLNLKSHEWTLLTDLNPEYREIQLGKVERIQWANRYGSQCAGFLIEPVGYEPGKRYPMVYLSVRPNDVFISDAVYTTAYAPQSLANAGFVVVVSQYPADNKIPKGMFPGEMSEAYNWMAMVESAIDLLADRGMVDRNNVGIAGFSRTSWLTDFTLTHSSYKFAAASSADSGVYTYGFYFMYNNRSIIEGMESEVGGPPYGETFKYWQEYAPPFNAEKVQAPVLMEYRDTGQSAFEFFTALSRLGKAVDLYCYPNGEHPLDTPWERIASLQRNVDWFRFWMQGYEGKAPDYDVSQFVRWRALRSKREASSDAAAPRLP